MIQVQNSIRRARGHLKPEPEPDPPAPTPAPTPPPRGKPEHHPLAEFVDQPVSWDIRLLGVSPTHVGWVERQIRTPRPIRRFILWAFRHWATWYGKGRDVVVVLRSPKVSVWAYEERQGICDGCPENDGGYCRACRCWKWTLAKLVHKNRRSKWLCPLMQHPGKYPTDDCPGCGRPRQSAPTAPGGADRRGAPQSPGNDALATPTLPQRPVSGCKDHAPRATIQRGNGQSQETLKG